MLTVLSVDPSLRNTGLTIAHFPDDGKMILEFETLKSVKGDNRLLVFRRQFHRIYTICKGYHTIMGVVENYSFGSVGNAFTQTIEAGASCRLGMAVRNIPIVEIAPRSWKLEVLRNGAADKKEIKEKMEILSNPKRRIRDPITRAFFDSARDDPWSNEHERDSFLLMIAFFHLLMKDDYLKGGREDDLNDLRIRFNKILKNV